MIEIKDISKIFGEQRALDHVSFSIQPGEVVGLLGPNGAGKSTLMKILTCYLPPSKGEAFVGGYSIFDDALKVRQIIGYLPEQNPLYTDMYVREFLRFVGGIYARKGKLCGKPLMERVEEMVHLVGLVPEANKRIGTLSKGYRQRVGLAQALLHDPAILILDEPTTGLDPNQLEEMRALIRKVGKTKIVLLSTHIMQEVEAVCNRAIIIHHGRIVSDEPLKDVAPGSLTEKFHKLTER
ncbi:MAG: ATP-binding cassette domain-containing protein [Bacteroidales bacterium]|nr:ATP-binding cassette domain-containing protein [Bacteroidales bacterium]